MSTKGIVSTGSDAVFAMKWVSPGIRTILIVEPDEATLASAVTALGLRFRTVATRSGQEAIGHLSEAEVDLVLVASALPDMGGACLCRHIRAHATSPVVIVAGQDTEADALASFTAGADGYVAKPYRLRELDARVHAALRRAPVRVRHDGEAIVVGDVTLNPERHEVRVRDRVVELPLREFQLLSVLLGQPGKIWSREALMRRIWVETPPSGTKSLDVHVRRIRGRIEDDPSRPSRILTVRGVGYRYAVPVNDVPADDVAADERRQQFVTGMTPGGEQAMPRLAPYRMAAGPAPAAGPERCVGQPM